MYDDVPQSKAGQPDPELEELKKLAQSDALKAYAWLRDRTARLKAKLAHFKQNQGRISQKQLKLAKIGLAGLLVALLAVKFVPGVIDRFNGGGDILGTQQTEADFSTLQPAGSQPTAKAFDESVGVAVFKDSLNGAAITVSQQKLPDNLKNNPSELQKLAISLEDKAIINRHDSKKGLVYIAQTQEGGNTVIFNYADLLVFMRSTELIEDQLWIDYVNQLQ